MRTFLIILVIIAIYMILRHLSTTKIRKQKTVSPKTRNPLPDNMVRCDHCGLHIPEREALRHGSHTFCSEEHKAAFIQSGQ